MTLCGTNGVINPHEIYVSPDTESGALRGKRGMQTSKITLVRDSREQKPYDFADYDCDIETVALPCGDYSISPASTFAGLIAVERKNGIDELVACLSTDRKRFEAELARARNFERFYVVIEGHLHDVLAGKYRSQMQPKAVIASVTAFMNRYGIPFLFCGGRGAAEMMTYQLLSKYVYELEKRYQAATQARQTAEA